MLMAIKRGIVVALGILLQFGFAIFIVQRKPPVILGVLKSFSVANKNLL